MTISDKQKREERKREGERVKEGRESERAREEWWLWSTELRVCLVVVYKKGEIKFYSPGEIFPHSIYCSNLQCTY